jgi:AcrR family transcriptional regulator
MAAIPIKNRLSPKAPQDTPSRILEAAERLFLQHGFAATSMRMITAEAEVNLAAVNYHFGSKDALIEAVFTRRLGPLNRQRLGHLDRLESLAEGAPLKLETIVEAFIGSAFVNEGSANDGARLFAQLLGRAYSEPSGGVRDILYNQNKEVIKRFKAALKKALPHLSAEELVWRMHFVFGSISYTQSGTDALRLVAKYELSDGSYPQTVVKRLLPFLCAGLQAPATMHAPTVLARVS